MSAHGNQEGEIIGYVEPWITSPGQRVAVKVSSTDPEYRWSVVRLINGLKLEHAPPLRSEVVIAQEDTPTQRGTYRRAASGSFALVKSWPPPGTLAGVHFSVYMQPWLVDSDHDQTLVSTLDVCSRSGFALVLDQSGKLSAIVGDGRNLERHAFEVELRRWRWLHLEVTIQDDHLSLQATHLPRLCEPAPASFRYTIRLDGSAVLSGRSPLTLGAGFFDTDLRPSSTHLDCFSGKLDSFRIDVAGELFGQYRTWAKYDFSLDIPSDRIVDTSGYEKHGILINAPTRAVKSHDWDGSESDWTKAEHGYGAIHFHEDDLDDAAWDTDFTVEIPDSAVSGAYAVVVQGVNSKVEDSITFFVRPHRQQSKKKCQVAMVMPTFTYLAYANERMHDQSLASKMTLAGGVSIFETEHYRRMVRRTDLGLSTYDVHKDGSGNVFSSAKRPILNMRPDYVNWAFHRPRELSADMLMIGFLEAKLGKGGYDVLTEHDLHAHGISAVEEYKILITGSHPEYPSLRELDAYAAFVAHGGYVMYLGGNGFYWCSETDPERPHRMEVRKGDQGCRSVTLPAGERMHSLSGAQGGLWRSRGRAPQTLFGVGAAACGSGPGVPYRFAKDIVRDAGFSWLFEGLAIDDSTPENSLLIGTQGFGGGASGDEIDRLDFELGTPENAVLLATSTGHDDSFCIFNEEVTFPLVNTLGPECDRVRSDMVIYETYAGGAVFSVGSINWYCSLGWKAYQNDVAIVTWNVLKEFMQRAKVGKAARL